MELGNQKEEVATDGTDEEDFYPRHPRSLSSSFPVRFCVKHC